MADEQKETKESIVGFLRGSGVSERIVGQIGRIIDQFNGNIPQFCAATNAQLEASYNKITPLGKRGLGKAFFDAFDLAVRRYKNSIIQQKRVTAEQAAVEQHLEKEATDRLRAEILDKQIDMKKMGELIAWIGLKFPTMRLEELLSWYDKVQQ